MKIFELHKYGTAYPIQLEVATYPEGNLAITMTTWSSGVPEPWSNLTVNLEGRRKRDFAFIDINNNGSEILSWIIRHGLGVPTGQTQQSGYCVYPEFHFRPDILRQIDPDGYGTYIQEQNARCGGMTATCAAVKEV